MYRDCSVGDTHNGAASSVRLASISSLNSMRGPTPAASECRPIAPPTPKTSWSWSKEGLVLAVLQQVLYTAWRSSNKSPRHEVQE